MNLDLSTICDTNFQDKALDIFKYQYANNDIYRDFCDSIHQNDPKNLMGIPFLPISFFKTHRVSCFPQEELNYFESSGTSGQVNSKHCIKDIENYIQSIEFGFRHFFGAKEYTILGLLPHYLERENSSLVYMVRHWMKMNQSEEYFFLRDFDRLEKTLESLFREQKEIILIGLSSALYDFSKQYSNENARMTIIETGGNKGSQLELPKEELITTLRSAFPKSKIISEYGMCELFSQMYSDEDLWFSCPPWMRLYVSELNDPMSASEKGTGVAKIIDLANIHSCSFIETQDLVQLREDGKFQILGRVDHSDTRGCSLMYN